MTPLPHSVVFLLASASIAGTLFDFTLGPASVGLEKGLVQW
jgi:hypothetical protein